MINVGMLSHKREHRVAASSCKCYTKVLEHWILGQQAFKVRKKLKRWSKASLCLCLARRKSQYNFVAKSFSPTRQRPHHMTAGDQTQLFYFLLMEKETDC